MANMNNTNGYLAYPELHDNYYSQQQFQEPYPYSVPSQAPNPLYPDLNTGKTSHVAQQTFVSQFPTQPSAPAFFPTFPNQWSDDLFDPELHRSSQPLIEKCKEVADSVLQKNSPVKSMPTPTQHHSSNNSGNNYNSGNTTFNIGSNNPTYITTHQHHTPSYSHEVPHSRKRTKQEEDKLSTESRVAAGAGGLAVIAGSLWKFGELYAKKEAISRSIKQLKDLEPSFSLGFQLTEQQSSLRKIYWLTTNLLERQRANSSSNLKLVSGWLITGGLLIGASLLSSKNLGIAGLITGVAVGALSLLKFSFSYFDTQDKEAAEDINKELDAYNSKYSNC
jgi:hypothetical protein